MIRVDLYFGYMDKGSFFQSILKLGFCSARECPIFAHRGQLCKFLNRECVGSIPIWSVPKHACMTHRNPILMCSFHYMPQVWVQLVPPIICLKVSLDLPLLKKYLLQTIIPCAAVENYVTYCEVLNLTYFPSLQERNILCFSFIKAKGFVNLCVCKGIDHRI